MAHREIKDQTYPQFARIGAALSSERRLELIDLLAQAPRNVEALAQEAEMSVANTSQHLQALKAAHLVETERDGTRIVYRLAGEDVLALWLALRATAEAQLPEVGEIVRNVGAANGSAGHVDRAELSDLVRAEDIVLLDVRPRLEFDHGHIPGALALPIEELSDRLSELPTNKRFVVYCRGSYCQWADEAVALLQRNGFDAARVEGGWSEWAGEHRTKANGDSADVGHERDHGEIRRQVI
ncbi:MAG: metalloregulator ArsR/SmtB family transcription factor [Candidatus Dormibacter sp.]